MGEGNGCDKCGLSCEKSRGGLGRPRQLFGISLQEVCERLEGAGDGRQKPPIEVDEAQKLLQLLDVSRRWEVLEGCDVLGERDQAILTDHVAQELQGGDRERTLGWVNG
jgi:hypothetical protein